MKTVTVTVYALSELTGRARENALDLMRGDAVESTVCDYKEAAEELFDALPCRAGRTLTGEDIRAAANKVGTSFAFDLADECIEAAARAGKLETYTDEAFTVDEAFDGIAAAEKKYVRKTINGALVFFSDSYLEERAAECDYYFTAAGKLFTGEAA